MSAFDVSQPINSGAWATIKMGQVDPIDVREKTRQAILSAVVGKMEFHLHFLSPVSKYLNMYRRKSTVNCETYAAT
jgi:hypothetical protein